MLNKVKTNRYKYDTQFKTLKICVTGRWNGIYGIVKFIVEYCFRVVSKRQVVPLRLSYLRTHFNIVLLTFC